MVLCHHHLCVTCYRALRHSQVGMMCMHHDSALGRDSSQSANRGTCFDDSDMLTDQNMMQLLTHRHRIRHTQKSNRWLEIRSKIRTVHQKMPAAPARAHGAQNRDRSAENALNMRTVGQKFSPREHREHENGDRSTEILPKMQTVRQ